MAAARALQHRKGRLAAARYLVEGPHAVAEALQAGGPHRVRELFVCEPARDSDVVAAAAAADVAVHVVADRVMARLCDTVTPQGIVAVVESHPVAIGTALADRPTLAAVLAGVSDPGNAGTVIRTADAAGADVVVVTSGSTDIRAGKAVRASAGSLFHLPVVTDIGPAAAAAAMRAAGLQLLAATADGADDLDDLADRGELARPTAWLFGNEAHGVDGEARALAGRCVRIPIRGRAESLNLAAAAAVCLFTSARALRGA